MTETKRIRWEDDGNGGFTGYVGTLEPWAFQLWQSPCDTGGYVLGDWVRLAAFPRADGTRSVSGKDPDILKAEAERWLVEFVSSLGAVFADVLYGKIETERDARREEAHLAAQDDDDEGMERAREMDAGAGALGWVLSVMDRMEAGQ